MARRDIRDVTPLGIKAINDNFIDLSYEVFGTASFTKKVEKQVTENAENIEILTNTVEDLDGAVSAVTQRADAFEISFSNAGGQNLIRNSGFIDGLTQWTVTQNTVGLVRTSSQYPDMPSGCALLVPMEIGKTNLGTQKITEGFNRSTKVWAISGYIRNTATVKGTTNPFASVQVEVVYTDDTKSYIAATDYTRFNFPWEQFKYRFTTDETKEVKEFSVIPIARDMTGTLYVSSMVLEEGEVVHSWNNAESEAFGIFHKFTKAGYEVLDANGAVILSLTQGMANEQNIGRADNVAENYPLRLPFNIGEEVSVINKAVLKWDIASFRTYSKGAASGGGATSGDGGSYSSTVGVYDWTQGLAAGTSGVTITSSNLGTVHAHTTDTAKLGHRHNVAVPNHAHSTPNHAHQPDFGILITAVTSNAFDIYIDGVLRTSVNAVRGEVDLSSWITTNGNHTIELISTTLKRIDANLFLKTYIRR